MGQSQQGTLGGLGQRRWSVQSGGARGIQVGVDGAPGRRLCPLAARGG
jgi:hypothetical protein